MSPTTNRIFTYNWKIIAEIGGNEIDDKDCHN